MNRTTPICLLLSTLTFAFVVLLTACGGGSSISVPPPASYSISVTMPNPSSLSAGGSSTSTVTVTPAHSYTGTVTLSCAVSGAGNPSPTCSLKPNAVAITGSAPAASTLTFSAPDNAPNASFTVTLSASDSNQQPPSDGSQSLALATLAKIQHIIIVFQENRTPDNLFQDPVLIANGADIVSSGKNSQGKTIHLASEPLSIDYDLSHKHDAFTDMCDLDTSSGICKMDGADLVSITCGKNATNCPPPNPQFQYVQASDVQPYFDMADQYTFGDHMFQTNEGPSFPAHQFIISGTSEPAAGSDLFVSENPFGVTNSGNNTGCTAPSAELVAIIDPSGSEASNDPIFPCFDHATLTDELDSAGLTWRYYTAVAGSIWTSPNAIQHICEPVSQNGSLVCTGADWVNNVSVATQENPAPILTDIASGQLQQISWVIPSGANSDHPGDLAGGPSWVASIVNAIGNSSYWSNTAIIVTWDDWGGWFDHVPPPKVITDGSSWGSGYVYGFRVPLVVISPYAKPAHISSVTHDFGSVLNLIEHTFTLPSLGFADAYADDLSDCFNFGQTPITFKTINAPLKADFFLHDSRPPTPPDND